MNPIVKAPTLNDLPAPPPGKTGWPWTEQNEALPEKTPYGSDWPKISIVTPSYNYGQFIEETIRSVLLQGYPNLEYIIIDGASTDNSVEIIKKYESWLSYWVSEKDQGQTDAINKGHHYCSGDVFAWLNADDLYYDQSTLLKVIHFYQKGYDFIVGECLNINADGTHFNEAITSTEKSDPTYFKKYLRYWSSGFLPQPAVFVKKEMADQCFPLSIELYYAMDFQFFLRVLNQEPKSVWIQEKLTRLRWHEDSKTMGTISRIDFHATVPEPEVHKVALAEAENLPTWVEKVFFRTQAFDYLSLQPYINSLDNPHWLQITKTLVGRTTLVVWPLFWKIFFRSLLGEQIYKLLKRTIRTN
jgi:glycosyltransferase involved in cell wall biosynthesis